MVSPVLDVLALLMLILLPIALGSLVVLAVGRRRRRRPLPRLADVGSTATGVLACPYCSGASFQSPPSTTRGLFALALGPFVFGSLSSEGRGVVECVTCGSCFARGLPSMAPTAAASS